MSKDIEQLKLFEMPPDWTKEWDGMPEYVQNDLMPKQSIVVHFRNTNDRISFAKLINQRINDTTKSVWYPIADKGTTMPEYTDDTLVIPKYPIYVISKGRWESRLTSKALEQLHVPYHIVIEPQEYDNYAEVIAPEKIYVLPFSNLGQGGIPARNWV